MPSPRNMPPRTYSTPGAFKKALEARLHERSLKKGESFDRTRMLLIFDRFLARITHQFVDTVTLKGGLALELRLTRARTTQDVDLRMLGSADDLLSRLQTAGRLELADYLSFEVVEHPEHPGMQGTVYDGFRFRAHCFLADKQYGNPFGIDIGFGDPMFNRPDDITAPDLLDFIGAPPPRVQVYPPETHLAEKLHAYTIPRSAPNSRVKDLPDMALLAQVRSYQADHLRAALGHTFDFRATHPIPTSLPDPPEAWSERYARLARNDALPWTSLAQVTDAARRFLDPVLASTAPLVWSPSDWTWTDPSSPAENTNS